jgi:hypothetical protein
MLNNLSNFWNIITGRMIKKLAEPSDLIPLGTRDSRYGGNYKPTAISFEDLLIQITPAPEIITDINTLFVSPNGLDTNPGTLENPLKTLIAAKNLSVSGDLIYVLPGTYVFDNRDLKYNATVNTEVNLWKTGVNYYFSPGAIINMYNITVTGAELYLFRPVGGLYDTCNVFGSLEYNQFSQGPDTSNGASYFFVGDEIGTKLGYTFNCTVKSIISTCNHPVTATRTTIDGAAQKSYFILNADEVSVRYIAGQTGAGCVIQIRDIGVLETNIKVKKIINNKFLGFYARNTNTASTIILDVDYMQCVFELVSVAGDISSQSTYRIKQGYYNNYTNVAGSALGISGTSAGNISLEGDFYDSVGNNTRPVMGSTASGIVTVNFRGNVYTNNISGAGRPIVLVNSVNTIFKFLGNIHYLGAVATTTAMATATNGTIIMTGTAITGNMGGAMTATTSGSVTFEACRFASGVTGSCISSSTFTVGSCTISNSFIIAGNNTALGTVGNYTIINSALKNNRPGVGFLNAGATGYLQLLNSTIVTTGGLAVNYTSTAPVTTANSNSNSTITATTLNGTITTLVAINII